MFNNILVAIFDSVRMLSNYYSGDQIEKNEMGGACSKYGGEKRCIQAFGGETGGKETIWKTQA
jgi:hypothetical protein